MSYVSGRVVDPQWVWELALRSRLSANPLDQILSERKDANGPSPVHPNSLVPIEAICFFFRSWDQIVKGLIYIYLSQYNRIGALGALSGEERTEPTFGFALFLLH
ncbi:UNVERIFIED_CONTAM: hypothetical protein Sangu_2829100 [Sesamum angustifolium]|uniref:Uncharacterized protein n=1 Tax=Sesamum angustifolium TaxID=2727405 RepID=A0AAW2IQX1_9LAMI